MNATVCDTGNTTESASETLDSVFDGSVSLYQNRLGYRFSIDALLLAYFVTVQRKDKIVDLGCGNGVIALALAHLHASSEITGIELQPAMAERARRNVRLNKLDARVKIVTADLRSRRHLPDAGSFAVAVCNPPYRKRGSGRVNIHGESQIARHELTGELVDFLGAAAFFLRNRGRMALVYPAVRCADVISAMRLARIEPKRLRMVHSFSDSAASLILIEGVKGGRAGLVAESPMIIYRQAEEYTEEVAKIIAGAQR